jgi:signal transduction histidine kinase
MFFSRVSALTPALGETLLSRSKPASDRPPCMQAPSNACCRALRECTVGFSLLVMLNVSSMLPAKTCDAAQVPVRIASSVFGTSVPIAAGLFDFPWGISDVPRALSEKVRKIDDDRSFFELRLQSAPPYATQSKIHAGFHSRFVATANEIQSVQVDLGRQFPINRIVLVPTVLHSENEIVEGYGFPVRFRVQVSNDPEFKDPDLVADHTSSDYPNPGRYPVQFPALELSGRYVRITVTGHSTNGGQAFFALGELIVLSGNRNVAAWRPVRATKSIERAGTWSREYLVDEVSILPLPMGVSGKMVLPSETYGFLSKPSSSPRTSQWVQVDLGKQIEIDEIRLVPARPPDQADIPGWGFPSNFRVEVATQPDLEDAVTYCDFSEEEVQHWTDRPLVIPAETREMFSQKGIGRRWEPEPNNYPSSPVTGRYVRLTATGLDPRIEPHYLALAEVQVYAGDANVAFEATVTASNPADRKAGKRWSPDFLVDEFTSRTRLLEYPAWLDKLETRRSMELRLIELTAELDQEVTRVWVKFGGGAAVAVFCCIAMLAWINWRQGLQPKIQTELLRTQIASDLHDDIGSNLGMIALLCQTMNHREGIPDELKPDLEEMREVALETSDAMRDILWLLRTPTSKLEEFIGRLRITTNRLLLNFETHFISPPEVPDTTIVLSWRRNVFLSFKEALHNAARHSHATSITVTIDIDAERLKITITDNGVGFDFEQRRDGLGIGSVTRRMDQIAGSASFHSTPGEGTSVVLDAPFHQLRYIRRLWRRMVAVRRKFSQVTSFRNRN